MTRRIVRRGGLERMIFFSEDSPRRAESRRGAPYGRIDVDDVVRPIYAEASKAPGREFKSPER